MIRWLAIGCLFFAVSCTDAGCSKLSSLGDRAKISCYSGGKLIYEGESTGKVSSERNSDGYYFKDAEDGRLKEVSGNCVIVYE
jgi:hypothetical protein